MFHIGQFLSFWLCYATTALWFELFLLFHFKYVTPAYLLIYFHFVLYFLFVWHFLSISTEFLIKVGHFCWYCLVKECELSENYVNLINAVTCWLPYYHYIMCIMYDFVVLLFGNFIFKFIFDGKLIWCKLFSEIISYLILPSIGNQFWSIIFSFFV